MRDIEYEKFMANEQNIPYKSLVVSENFYSHVGYHNAFRRQMYIEHLNECTSCVTQRLNPIVKWSFLSGLVTLYVF